MNDYGEPQNHEAQQDDQAHELIRQLNLLDAVDQCITPEHVAKRFRELLGDTGDSTPPALTAERLRRVLDMPGPEGQLTGLHWTYGAEQCLEAAVAAARGAAADIIADAQLKAKATADELQRSLEAVTAARDETLKEAAQMIRDAKDQARRILADANNAAERAAGLVREAEDRARQILADASNEANRIIAGARNQQVHQPARVGREGTSFFIADFTDEARPGQFWSMLTAVTRKLQAAPRAKDSVFWLDETAPGFLAYPVAGPARRCHGDGATSATQLPDGMAALFCTYSVRDTAREEVVAWPLVSKEHPAARWFAFGGYTAALIGRARHEVEVADTLRERLAVLPVPGISDPRAASMPGTETDDEDLAKDDMDDSADRCHRISLPIGPSVDG